MKSAEASGKWGPRWVASERWAGLWNNGMGWTAAKGGCGRWMRRSASSGSSQDVPTWPAWPRWCGIGIPPVDQPPGHSGGRLLLTRVLQPCNLVHLAFRLKSTDAVHAKGEPAPAGNRRNRGFGIPGHPGPPAGGRSCHAGEPNPGSARCTWLWLRVGRPGVRSLLVEHRVDAQVVH